MATTLDGEQLTGVTALNTLAVFEDIYDVQAGATYNPAAKGERGFMKASDAATDDGVNVLINVNYTPLDIETQVAAAGVQTLVAPPPPPPEPEEMT